MTFAAPAYLYAAPAVALPIVIYLLFRRRRQDVPWGAMYILRKVMETRSRTATWLQYLVLALRTLACAAVIALFAQPRSPWEAGLPTAPPGTHRVILVDRSASMQLRLATGTALDSAVGLARRLALSTGHPGTVSLLPLDAEEAETRPTPLDETALDTYLHALLGTPGPADWQQSLRTAEDILRASPAQHRELFILSDFAARDLAGSAGTAFRAALRRLRDRRVTLHLCRLGDTGTENFALHGFAPAADVLLANQPIPFHFTLGYYGAATEGSSLLRVTDPQGNLLLEEPLTLSPGQDVRSYDLALPAGRPRLTATLRPDALEADDRAVRSFTVVSEVRLVVVQNLSNATGFDNPRTWIDLALRNPEAGDGGSHPQYNSAAEAYAAHAAAVNAQGGASKTTAPCNLVVEGKIPDQINRDLFASSDAVMLIDLDRLPPEALTAVDGYARRGGTVLLAPGAACDAGRFNQTFPSLTPAPLAPPRHEEVDPQRYEQCLFEGEAPALLAALESPEHGNLPASRFYNAFDVDPQALHPDARAWLSLSDGTPLLLSRARGRGRVLLWTAGLNGKWNSLVVHPGFPVFLLRLLHLGADQRRFPNNLEPGAPLLTPLSVPEAKLVRPDGTAVILPTVAVGETRFLRYDDTVMPGTYDIRTDIHSEAPGLLFHVRDPHPEADIRPLGQEGEAALAAAGADLLDGEASLIRHLGERYGGPNRHVWLALALFLALAAEALITWRFFA